MLKISNELSKNESLDTLYKKTLEYTIDVIKNTKYGSILILNKDTGLLEFKAIIGSDIDQFSKTTLPVHELFLYTINNLKEPAIIKNPIDIPEIFRTQKDKEILNNSVSLKYKTILSAPLYKNNEFFGCISIDNFEKKKVFGKKELDLIKFISRHLSLTVQNIEFTASMKKDLYVDALTEAKNRRYFNDIILSERREKRKQNNEIVMIDLDDFKTINDRFGHEKGDQALQYVSRIIRRKIRHDDELIRYAGDEFIIIFYECHVNVVKNIIQGIIEYLNSNPIDGIILNFSYGIAKWNQSISVEDALRDADRRMYEQKKRKT